MKPRALPIGQSALSSMLFERIGAVNRWPNLGWSGRSLYSSVAIFAQCSRGNAIVWKRSFCALAQADDRA